MGQGTGGEDGTASGGPTDGAAEADRHGRGSGAETPVTMESGVCPYFPSLLPGSKPRCQSPIRPPEERRKAGRWKTSGAASGALHLFLRCGRPTECNGGQSPPCGNNPYARTNASISLRAITAPAPASSPIISEREPSFCAENTFEPTFNEAIFFDSKYCTSLHVSKHVWQT